MGDALWWLPSVVVFGSAAIVVAGVVAVARRRRSIRAETVEHLEIRAGQALVAADEAVRAASDERDFALAQFGEDAAASVSSALDAARGSLREAFRLRQRLSDEIPDTEAERRAWSSRILSLCEAATAAVSGAMGALDARRTDERDVPARLAAVRRRIAEARAGVPEALAGIDRVRAAHDAAVLSDHETAPARAAALADVAERSAHAAEDHATRGEAAVGAVAEAERAVGAASALLAGVARLEERLAEASRELDQAIAETDAALAEAMGLRDASEPTDAADDLAAALSALRDEAGRARARGRRDPVAALDRLRAARERLDAACAGVRSATQRLAAAREAFAGERFTAASHLDVARELIEANRTRVGADARTRLTEADRQLALADAASDPVEALDAVRRASRLAQDADALARYDAGQRTAPLRR